MSRAGHAHDLSGQSGRVQLKTAASRLGPTRPRPPPIGNQRGLPLCDPRVFSAFYVFFAICLAHSQWFVMTNRYYRMIKDQDTNLMVEIHGAVQRPECAELLMTFAWTLTIAIKHVNPTVQWPQPKQPSAPTHLYDDMVKIQCGTTGCSLTLEMSDYHKIFLTVLVQGLAQLLYKSQTAHHPWRYVAPHAEAVCTCC